jgi:hypothetical protein
MVRIVYMTVTSKTVPVCSSFFIVIFFFLLIYCRYIFIKGTAVAQRLRCCTTNWKVAGSIPDGVIGIFH